MRDVREVSTTPVVEDFRNAGGTPIVVDTNAQVAYAIDSADSIFALSGAAGGGITNIRVSAGAASAYRSDLTFANSGGVSFGLSANGVVTATVATDYQSAGAYLTTAMQSDQSSLFAGLGETTTTQAGTALGLTVNTAGVNIAYPAWLTTAAASNHSHGNPTLNLTNLSGTTGSNSAGLTISLSAAPYLSTFYAIGSTIPGYSTSSTYSSMVVAGGGLASVGLDAAAGLVIVVAACGLGTSITTTAGTDLKATVNTDGLSIAHPVWLTTAQAPGAYLTTAMASNAGSNFAGLGETTGTTAGTDLKLTVASDGVNISFPKWITTAAASDHSHGNPTLALTNLSGTTASASNGLTLSLSAAAPGGGGAGTNTALNLTNLTGTLAVNTNGVSLSMSAAAAAGGADKSASWHEINQLITTGGIWNNATYSNRPFFVPFKMGEAITAVNSIDMYVSRTGGTSAAASLHVGFYTVANATSMNLLSSTSFNISLTTSAQFSGIRRIQWTGLGALSLSPGQYVLGLLATQAGTASWGMNFMGIGTLAVVGVIHPGTNSTAATASGTHLLPFAGIWNATSAALPSAVAASSISGGQLANEAQPYVAIKAISA